MTRAREAMENLRYDQYASRSEKGTTGEYKHRVRSMFEDGLRQAQCEGWCWIHKTPRVKPKEMARLVNRPSVFE